MEFCVDFIPVATADADALEVPAGDEVGDDALGGAFGNPDCLGHIAQTDFWVAGDAEEYVRVVREEGPLIGVVTVEGGVHASSFWGLGKDEIVVSIRPVALS